MFVLAVDPEAQNFAKPEELVLRTHFCTNYLLEIENRSNKPVDSLRLSMKSHGGHKHSLIIPSLPAREKLALTTADLEGWMVQPEDVVSLDAPGSSVAELRVTKSKCRSIDGGRSPREEFPCLVFVRKASFSSNFVLKVVNVKKRKIKIIGFQSEAGSIKEPIEIPPEETAEVGWYELSGDRNLTAGENFRIQLSGGEEVLGVVAADHAKGNGGVWAVLGALGGLALAAAGG
jgi:hypothetical protein